MLPGPSSDTAPGRTMLRLLKQTLRLFQYIEGWTPDQLLRLLFGLYRGRDQVDSRRVLVHFLSRVFVDHLGRDFAAEELTIQL